MAPHSGTLAWKTPWTDEPGRLQSMGLLRVGDLLFGDTMGPGSIFLQRRPWPQGFLGAFGGLHSQNSTWGLKGLEMPSDQNGQLLQLT